MRSARLILFIVSLTFVVGAARAAGEVVLVKADSLSLRAERSAKSKRKKSLKTYEPVTIKKREGRWARVKTAEGKEGWVLTRSKGAKPYLSRNAYVSVDGGMLKKAKARQLNVRVGPGTEYAVRLRLASTYPLRVLKRSGSWLMIEDFDGDQGWVSAKYVNFEPYVITNWELANSNVRTGPGKANDIAYTAERGVILKVLGEEGGWLHVIDEEGDKGWISSKIVFGWSSKGTVDKG